jgi:hypothetical protein
MVWRNDRDDVDAIGTRAFRAHHFIHRTITTARIEQQLCATVARALRIRREHAGDELVAVVEARRHPMHGADERAAAAADHAESQATAHFSPSIRRLAAASAPELAKSSNARSATRMM